MYQWSKQNLWVLILDNIGDYKMRKMQIRTRITSNANGSGNLTIRVNNGWSFWNKYTVQNTQEIRDYLKSDDFKEFANTLYSKYENLTYNDMCELLENDCKDDNKKVEEKLDDYLWKAAEEPFKITFTTKLVKMYSNGFAYKVLFGNNKSGGWCARTQFYEDVRDRKYANIVLDDVWNYLQNDKELNEKLSSYTNWYDFTNDFMNDKNDISKIIDKLCEKCA